MPAIEGMPPMVVFVCVIYRVGSLVVLCLLTPLAFLAVTKTDILAPPLEMTWKVIIAPLSAWLTICVVVAVGARRGWTAVWFLQVAITILAWVFLMLCYSDHSTGRTVFAAAGSMNLLVQTLIFLFWFRFDVRDWFGLGWHWNKWSVAGALLFGALLLGPLLWWGSQSDGPGPDLDTTTLVGAYVPNHDGMECIKKLGYDIPGICLVLRPDGSFTFFNSPELIWSFPSELPDHADPASKKMTHVGTWCVDRDSGKITLSLAPNLGTWPVYIWRSKPPYQLNFIIGDPDDGRNLTVEKISAGSGR